MQLLNADYLLSSKLCFYSQEAYLKGFVWFWGGFWRGGGGFGLKYCNKKN